MCPGETQRSTTKNVQARHQNIQVSIIPKDIMVELRIKIHYISHFLSVLISVGIVTDG